ncbi:cysteine hydrolase [Candidatus Woesearchaeota archaeon]|nr:cysteine hydrolase [Candidatus Woesearchaeota archaeon]
MKTLFWNVDTQNDFMNKDGALYVQDAENIKANLSLVTELARQYKIPVLNTADWHTPESEEISNTPDYKTTFPPHCIQDSEGAQFGYSTKPREDATIVDWQEKTDLSELKNHKGDIIIYKDKFDVFTGNPQTTAVLEILNPDRVVVYGVATNVCVDYAVKGLIDKVKQIYVIEDAIKGLPGLPSPEDAWYAKGVRKTYATGLEELLMQWRIE